MCGILNPGDRFAVPPVLANYVLGADDTGTLNWTPNRPEPSNGTWFAYEFGGRGASGHYTNNATGALTAVAVSGQYQGVGQHSTTTGTTNRSTNTLDATAFQFNTTSGLLTYDTVFQIPTLSVTAQAFGTWCGFTDTTNTLAQVDGAYIETSQALGGDYFFVTSANSVRTSTDTTIAQSAGTWQRARVQVTNNTTTSCWIVADGIALGTATITQTSNIPSGVGRETGAGNLLLKSAGSTASTYLFVYQLTSRVPINTPTVQSYALYDGLLSGGDGTGLTTLNAGQVIDINVAGNPSVEERIPSIESILFFTSDTINGPDFTSVASGAGTSIGSSNNGVSGQPPDIVFGTGTTNSGLVIRSIPSLSGSATFVFDANSAMMEYESLQAITTALSASGQEFNTRSGWVSDGNSSPVDGASFLLDSLTTTDIVCQTTQASTTTSTTTAVAPALSGYYYTRVQVTANTQAQYFAALLGNSWSTAVATHATNIPSGSGQAVSPAFGVLKLSGTTQRVARMSYQSCYQRRSP